MSNRIELGRLLGRTITVAALVIGSTVVTTTAFAGNCPADKMKADAREPVKFAPVGVTDTTLGAIDLAKEPVKPFNVTRSAGSPINPKTAYTNLMYERLMKGTVWEHYQLVMTQWPRMSPRRRRATGA